MITGIEQFKGMTREQFLGRPKIVVDQPTSLAKVKFGDGRPEPFLNGTYKAVFTRNGAMVYDGVIPIAHYVGGEASVLFVNPNYRKRGIALELMYQRAIRYGRLVARSRTAISQTIAVKVWDRIQTELKAK